MSNTDNTADQEAIERQKELLATHREHLAILLVQQAQFGAYAPPHVISEISATQQALRPIKAWLHSQGVLVADEPNDEVQIAVDSALPHPSGDKTTQTINNQAPNQGAQGIFNAPVHFGSIRSDNEQHKR
jgi:hypothetical protein